MAEKKISDLTNKENANNDDEFVFPSLLIH